jgi:CubicO group peptidase (beta-lactamase class C family)
MNHLQKLLDNSVKSKQLHGVSMSVYHNGKAWTGVSGNLGLDDLYFIASTTKLFTSALIFKLRKNGNLDLGDRIARFLPDDTLEKLHFYKGKDYSNQITISNLLAHTSGIPDYFQSEQSSYKSLEAQLKNGDDSGWNFQQAIDWSKRMNPLFEPSAPSKAHYSDTNYQLLGRIIENVYGESLKEVVRKEICNPLNLSQTYLYSDPTDIKPQKMYFKANPLNIPKAMASFGADGGVVSTSKELMVFLRAFMTGELFPPSYLEEIQLWNKIFFPLESGIGIHRFKAPWYFSPFKRIPEVIGHSGLSGAFAFHAPEIDAYLTGTVNQIYHPQNTYKLIMKTVAALT